MSYVQYVRLCCGAVREREREKTGERETGKGQHIKLENVAGYRWGVWLTSWRLAGILSLGSIRALKAESYLLAFVNLANQIN